MLIDRMRDRPNAVATYVALRRFLVNESGEDTEILPGDLLNVSGGQVWRDGINLRFAPRKLHRASKVGWTRKTA